MATFKGSVITSIIYSMVFLTNCGRTPNTSKTSDIHDIREYKSSSWYSYMKSNNQHAKSRDILDKLTSIITGTEDQKNMVHYYLEKMKYGVAGGNNLYRKRYVKKMFENTDSNRELITAYSSSSPYGYGHKVEFDNKNKVFKVTSKVYHLRKTRSNKGLSYRVYFRDVVDYTVFKINPLDSIESIKKTIMTELRSYKGMLTSAYQQELKAGDSVKSYKSHLAHKPFVYAVTGICFSLLGYLVYTLVKWGNMPIDTYAILWTPKFPPPVPYYKFLLPAITITAFFFVFILLGEHDLYHKKEALRVNYKLLKHNEKKVMEIHDDLLKEVKLTE